MHVICAPTRPRRRRRPRSRPAPRRSTDAGRHRRSRRGRPLDRRASCWRTATRCCSSTRTRRRSGRASPGRVAAGRRVRDRLAGRGGAAALQRGRSPRPATTRSTWSSRCWPRPSTACRAVVARVNHPKNEWLFNESWGVDVAVSTPRLLSALVEEAVSVGDLVRLLTFRQGDANLVELTLPDGRAASSAPGSASASGRTDTALVAILREGRVHRARRRRRRWRPATSCCSWQPSRGGAGAAAPAEASDAAAVAPPRSAPPGEAGHAVSTERRASLHDAGTPAGSCRRTAGCPSPAARPRAPPPSRPGTAAPARQGAAGTSRRRSR